MRDGAGAMGRGRERERVRGAQGRGTETRGAGGGGPRDGGGRAHRGSGRVGMWDVHPSDKNVEHSSSAMSASTTVTLAPFCSRRLAEAAGAAWASRHEQGGH
eukprot:366028-Chlamydomonas_euryale.AAC.30